MWTDVAGRRVAGSGCLSVPGLAEHIKRGSVGPAGVERVWQGIRLRDARWRTAWPPWLVDFIA
jgi:hypothetical protein